MSRVRSITAWFWLTTVLYVLSAAFQAASAARIPWCMRVVPNGEIVVHYGATGCRR